MGMSRCRRNKHV